MTWLETRELYRLFLESDWWRDLSRRKRALAVKCERCGNLIGLQAHHRVYRDNWFDTRLEDLECVCRTCHEREHGLPQVEGNGRLEVRTWAELQRARGKRLIGREQFLRLKEKFSPEQRQVFRRPKRIKKHRKPKPRKQQGVTPWYYNPTVRKRWKQRGTSSN